MTTDLSMILDRMWLALHREDLEAIEQVAREFIALRDAQSRPTLDSLAPITWELDEPAGPQNVDATGSPVEV